MDRMSSSLNNQRKAPMYSNKLVLNSREALVILDDRNQWHRNATEFLCEEMKRAGCNRTVHVLVQIDFEAKLFRILRDTFPDFSATNGDLCIFPGRSAAILRKEIEWVDCYIGPVIDCNSFLSVYAERFFDSSGNPFALAGEILPEQVVVPRVQRVLVVDDVISTGATMRALRERNKHKFPKAEWFAATPLSRLEKINGYKEVITTLLVPPQDGLKVPINSLSTLIENQTLAVNYATKHCCKTGVFLEALSRIGSEYGLLEKLRWTIT